MNNFDIGHKILSVISAILLIYIIFLHGCKKDNINNGIETVVSIDTVTHSVVYDTNWYDTTQFKYITVETPKIRYVDKYVYDTIPLSIYSANDFDQIMSHPSIYMDSMIKDDTVHLAYRATVRGYLDKIELGYKIMKPYLVEKETIIETEIKIEREKKFNGLYFGLNAGTRLDTIGLSSFTPMLELSFKNTNIEGGYDFMDGSIEVGIKRRISFRRKNNIIPHP